jgi:hypothetical protein
MGAMAQDPQEELALARAERDAAVAEREAMRAEMAGLRDRPPSRRLARRTLAVILVAVSCLSFLTAGIGVWANRSLLDTDVWVEHTGPLIDDPVVQAAVSAKITEETMKLIDPEALIKEALPERGQVLAVPLSNAVQTFVAREVDKVVATEQFKRLWVELNRRAHARAVQVLRGDAKGVTAGDESVTISLVPAINQVLAQVTSVSPELFGKTINIPDVSIDEIPTVAIDKVNSAFGTNLPEDFGQVTIYDHGKLKETQQALAFFDTLLWVSVVVFALSTVTAMAASVNRRRTFLELAVVDVLLLVLMRRAAMIAQAQLLGVVREPVNRRAVGATSDAVLQGLFDGTRILLWIFGILIVLMTITGPWPWAVSLRRRTASLVTGVATAAHDRGTDPATTNWVVKHRDPLRIAGVVVALLVLWWGASSWLSVLIVLAILAAYEVALSRLVDAERTPELIDEVIIEEPSTPDETSVL